MLCSEKIVLFSIGVDQQGWLFAVCFSLFYCDFQNYPKKRFFSTKI